MYCEAFSRRTVKGETISFSENSTAVIKRLAGLLCGTGDDPLLLLPAGLDGVWGSRLAPDPTISHQHPSRLKTELEPSGCRETDRSGLERHSTPRYPSEAHSISSRAP